MGWLAKSEGRGATRPPVLAWIRLASGIRSSQQKAGTEWVIFSENELVVPREVRTSLNLRHHGGDAGDLRLPDHASPEACPNDAGMVEGLFGR